MILGKITGKSSTRDFQFKVDNEAKKFDYLQIMHSSGNFTLAQIEEIEKDQDKTIAFCSVIGYKDDNQLKSLRFPLEPGIEVLKANDEFIQETLKLENKTNTAYMGTLDGHENIKVFLDLNKALTKHVSVLAKSGSGKSYSVAVLLEELLEKKIPVIVIDPHGEYPSLKYPNSKDKEGMIRFGIEPKSFLKQVIEFSPDIKLNPDAKPLKLNSNNLNASELIHLLPTKLSSSQIGLIYSALRNLGGKVNFNELLIELELTEDNNSKWTLINIFEYVKKLNLFSESPTLMNELVQHGKMSIVNLRGIAPDIQGMLVYKLINDLFTERKKNNIPPFFLVIEECHNFIPERSFGEAKSSAIIRQVAAEGRKFGLGLCLISQRPSRVEKSALSQCSTQIILKVTNPNDVKAISNSVEGITKNTERDIPNLQIGTAMIAGLIDIPVIVNIRPRKTKHGGEAITSFVQETIIEDKDFTEVQEEYTKEGESFPIIKQKFTLEDIKLMHGKEVSINHELIPAVLITCDNKDDEFKILIDLMNLQIIDNLEEVSGESLLKLNLQEIKPNQEKILDIAVKLKEFKAADIFSKSGLQFSELYETMNILTRKGYLIKNENDYTLSPQMNFIANINEKEFYQPIQFSRTTAKEQKAKYEYTVVKDFINKFFQVKEIKECFIEKFSIQS
ncbi:MAG: ATP-binding protein [Nanoarchaeota archaeon]|nr:ATP-binding protein [Nanoarchaeota archaeon]